MKQKKRTLSLPVISLLLGSVLCQSLSLTCGKKAGLSESTVGIFLYVNTWYAAHLLFLALQAVFWNATLKFTHLSFAYPFNSLGILITAIFGVFFFSETLTTLNIIGIAVIIMGIFVMNQPPREQANDL